jgi:hypothetical protein
MVEERQSFWDRIFSLTYRSDREEKILEYVIHRLTEGAVLEDIAQEPYVRRHASPEEVEDLLDNPTLVEAIREKMERDFEELSQVLSRARGRDK